MNNNNYALDEGQDTSGLEGQTAVLPSQTAAPVQPKVLEVVPERHCFLDEAGTKRQVCFIDHETAPSASDTTIFEHGKKRKENNRGARTPAAAEYWQHG